MGVANLALRGAQVVITIVELGLAAYATYLAFQTTEVCEYDAFENAVICTDIGGGGVSGIGAFLLFNCVWTLIILAVLCLVPLCTKLHPIAVAVLDGLTMLFWFSGAIGFAVAVGTAASYIGSSNGLAIPGAMAGLAFLIWLLFLASFILNLRTAKAARKGGATHSYGPNAPAQGPNNFPTQAGPASYPMQSPSKDGTYVQSMPSPQQQQYQQPMQSPQQQYQQPMHSPQQQYQQPHQQPMPHQSPTQSPVHQQSPPQQYQQPMHPQQQNQWAQSTSPPPSHNMQGPAGGNSAYYNQNPELAHV